MAGFYPIAIGLLAGNEAAARRNDCPVYSPLNADTRTARGFTVAVNSFTVDERAGDDAAQLAFGKLIDTAACR